MQFAIDPSHPALPGHFPGHPIVPGVVLLNHVFAALRAQPNAPRIAGIRRLKFLRPVLPGDVVRLVIESSNPPTAGTARVGFECWVGDAQVLSGVASLAA